MTDRPTSARAKLLPGISQFEVDFVIPRVGVDLPIGIDPFLLFKSRDPELSGLHQSMLAAFNRGVALVRDSQIDRARELLDFPEVAEIGFGYTRKGKQGSGVGTILSELIVQTLIASPALLHRGIRHIEEMQLVSLGIGPDRLSDVSANLLKRYLIDYTQKQCRLWDIKLFTLPIAHVFDLETLPWSDGYDELPISPYDGTPILLVPRRLVRSLPWINYEDFEKSEFSASLRAQRARRRSTTASQPGAALAHLDKQAIVSIARTEVERIDRYVSGKEAAAAGAQPTGNYLDDDQVCIEAAALKEKLRGVSPGNEEAAAYQRLVLEVLNFLFNPELIDGKLEVRTIDGTERRDIIFTNDSDMTFWDYVRTEHSSLFIMFEAKNTKDVNNFNIDQVATYLDNRIGYFAIIVTRNPVGEAQLRKTFSVYNGSQQRKIILVLVDEDVRFMLDLRCSRRDPTEYIRKMYRTFRTTVQ